MKNWLSIILLAVSVNAHAQHPGGVSGTEVWFKTVPVTADLQGSYRWQDFSGDSTSLVYNTLSQSGSEYTLPRRQVLAVNFHPSLSFSNGVQALLTRAHLAQMTAVGVFAPTVSNYDKDQVLYTVSGRKGDNTLLSKDRLVHSNGTSYLDYGSDTGEDLVYSSTDSVDATTFKENIIKVATLFKANSPNTTIWGDAPNSTIAFGGTVSEDTYDTSIFGNNAFTGHIPEFIVYGRLLTPSERLRVESYLAMKYAVTLNTSYLDSEGNLTWDKADNASHPYRVTAIGRDDAASLMQPISTTSYEETPHLASDNDSYHDADSYALPTGNRLLTIGREHASAIPDRGFLFVSDDGAPAVTATATDTLWHVMQRTWLVRTNILSSAPDSTLVRWSGEGFDVSRHGWLDDVRQTSASAPSYVKTPVLDDGNGYVEFVCPSGHPSFEAGFTTKSETACKYGFLFSTDGSVYAIQDGTAGGEIVAEVSSGSIISVQKDGRTVRLMIDGRGGSSMTITLEDEKMQEGCTAILHPVTAESALSLSSVRTGGVGDTGYLAELGNGLTGDKELASHCRRRTFMLIDPSGEGRFDLSPESMVQCSEPDMERGKTVFHNILWDADGNGRDMFTFACFDGISADVEAHPSTCLDGVPQKDGSLDIGINVGTPVYKYVLTADTVAGTEKGSVIASGQFLGDTHHIDGLATGTYTLTVTQGGGNDIHGKGNLLYSAYSHTDRRFTGGDIEWTVAGTGSWYRIGAEPSVVEDVTKWGYDVHGDKAYFIIDGYTSLTQGVTVKAGDTLGLRISGIYVRWYHNGVEVLKKSAWTLRLWRVCVKYGNGDTHITNLTIDGQPVEDFETSGNVQVETPKTCTVAYTVHIGNGCDPSSPNGVEPWEETGTEERGRSKQNANPSEDDSQFSVYREDETTGMFNAVLDCGKRGPASLMVFDTSGKLIHEGLMEGDPVKTLRFSVPSSGVYVVKAITNDGEHTKKILAK